MRVLLKTLVLALLNAFKIHYLYPPVSSRIERLDLMTHAMLADFTASITELKKNPMGTIAAGHGRPVAILNRNEPAFYCVPAEEFRTMMALLEDAELNAIADSRENGPFVSVSLSDL